MPELPELEVIKDILSNEIEKEGIESPVFTKPYILKGFFPGFKNSFPSQIDRFERRGKFLLLYLKSKVIIVMHLMKAGRIKITDSKTKIDKFTACYFLLKNKKRVEISEYGKEKLAKVYIVKDINEIAGFKGLGVEPLVPSFTIDRLKSLLFQNKKRLKNFLKDQRIIAGIGNAYADEILWGAQLSPFKFSDSLTNKEIKKLYHSIKSILKNAAEEIKILTKGKLFIKEPRTFMKVHNKKGELCPRCGSRIEWVYSKKNTTYYCPHCQTGGKVLKDRRLSKFLK